MAKIQVTESELRDIVRESVVAVLNEGFDNRMARQANRRNQRAQNAWQNYQTVYNNANATEAEKEKARQQYYRANMRNGVGNLKRAQEAEAQIAEKDKEIQNLTQKNTQLAQEKSTLSNQVEQLNGTIAQLQKTNKTLNVQLAQAKQTQGAQQQTAPATIPGQKQAMPNPTALATTQQNQGLVGQRPGTAVA